MDILEINRQGSDSDWTTGKPGKWEGINYNSSNSYFKKGYP